MKTSKNVIMSLVLVAVFMMMAAVPIASAGFLTKTDILATELGGADFVRDVEIGETAYTKRPFDVGLLYKINVIAYSESNVIRSVVYDKYITTTSGIKINNATFEVISYQNYNTKVGTQFTTDTHGANDYYINGATKKYGVTTISGYKLDETPDLVPKVWVDGSQHDNTAQFSMGTYIEILDDMRDANDNNIGDHLFRVPVRVKMDHDSAGYNSERLTINVFVPFQQNGLEKHNFKLQSYRIQGDFAWKSISVVAKSWWQFPLLNAVTNGNFQFVQAVDTTVIDRIGFDLFKEDTGDFLAMTFRGATLTKGESPVPTANIAGGLEPMQITDWLDSFGKGVGVVLFIGILIISSIFIMLFVNLARGSGTAADAQMETVVKWIASIGILSIIVVYFMLNVDLTSLGLCLGFGMAAMASSKNDSLPKMLMYGAPVIAGLVYLVSPVDLIPLNPLDDALIVVISAMMSAWLYKEQPL